MSLAGRNATLLNSFILRELKIDFLCQDLNDIQGGSHLQLQFVRVALKSQIFKRKALLTND